MTNDERLDGLAGWATSVMDALGAAGAGLLIAAENLFPPIPSEIVLPLAGFTASRGGFTLAEALVWTTLGSVVGALALYGVGAAVGRDRARRIVAWLPLVDLADLDRAEAWFTRHGAKAVLLGRMVPLVRSLVSVPAGTTRMSVPLFLLLTTVGSAAWNAVFVLAGYALGENWRRVEPYAGALQLAVIAVGGIAVVVAVARRLGARRVTG